MSKIMWLKQACEYMGGERDEGPPRFPLDVRSALWGLWWGLLGCAIIAFCGQSSKFIYIDF
jgi:hypothetical protein